MTRLVILIWLCVCVLRPAGASATVIWSNTFESLSTAGDACTQLLAITDVSRCIEEATSDISIVESITGFSGSMPSGTKVMRAYADGSTVQTEVGISIGNAASASYDNFIPADHWFQFALYVNHSGAELSSTSARPAKLWYPMRSYNNETACTTINHGCQFILEGTRGSSYNPSNDASLNGTTDGSMWIATRDMVPATDASWAGAATGDENKLGQTTLTDWIRPNRWNIIRCHSNQTTAAALELDCWLANKGSAFTHILSWHGGETVAGSAFTWATTQTPIGHRVVTVPSTVPANATTGTVLYMYLDDIYIATSEADLPTYTATVTTRPSGGSRITGVRIQ